MSISEESLDFSFENSTYFMGEEQFEEDAKTIFSLKTLCFAALKRNKNRGIRNVPMSVKLAIQNFQIECCLFNSTFRAIQSNHVSCLNRMYFENKKLLDGSKQYAMEFGRLECLEFLHACDSRWSADGKEMVIAMKNNHLECVAFAYENQCPWHPKCLDVAMESGSVECIQYARSRGCRWGAEGIMLALGRNNMHCVNYALNHGAQFQIGDARCAAQTGDIEALRFLNCLGYVFHECDVTEGLRAAQVECVKFMLYRGYVWTSGNIRGAILSRNIAVVQWTVENGCPIEITEVESCYEELTFSIGDRKVLKDIKAFLYGKVYSFPMIEHE
jgi:hypothetical protein